MWRSCFAQMMEPILPPKAGQMELEHPGIDTLFSIVIFSSELIFKPFTCARPNMTRPIIKNSWPDFAKAGRHTVTTPTVT